MSATRGDGDADSFFVELLGSLAPNSGDGVMIIKSYFDESYNDGLMCVAGYSFTSSNARRLDAAWARMLRKYCLPYFRMSACNSNTDPFEDLSEAECIAVAKEAISIINRYAHHGYACTVDATAFERIVTKKGFVSTPYEFCVWMILVASKSVVSVKYPQSVLSYFFESGFRDQKNANNLMHNIFASPDLRSSYRYGSHSFVDKTLCRPTQAADLLSWQWYKDMTRRRDGRTSPRGDLKALTDGTPHSVFHAADNELQKLVDGINARAGSPVGNEIAGIAGRNPKSPLFPRRSGERGDAEAYKKLVQGKLKDIS